MKLFRCRFPGAIGSSEIDEVTEYCFDDVVSAIERLEALGLGEELTDDDDLTWVRIQ